MTKDEKIKFARLLALISGAFTVLVALLLMLNYLQIQSTDPIESKAMHAMVERLSSEPANQELIDEIRKLDLLSRKAYFNSLWQVRFGSYLLLFGAIVFVVSLRYGGGIRFVIEKPSGDDHSPHKISTLNQRWILGAVGVVLLFSLWAAYSGVDYLKMYQLNQDPLTETAEQKDQIEKLEISFADDSKSDVKDSIFEQDSDSLLLNESGEEFVAEEESMPEEPKTPEKVALTESLVWQNHNAFRGPWGNGLSRHTNIPIDWDGETGKNILWSVDIPLHGYNSPVLWGDQLFMSGADENKRMVFGYNRHTGQKLWEYELKNIPGSPAVAPKTTEDTGLAAPTLTVDGNLVFAIFGTGDIIALDLQGKRIWARNLGVPDNHYGHSSSLLVWNDKIFVQYDTHSGSKVMALDTQTGDTVWETSRTSDVSWASPILAKVNGTFQLILLANPDLSSYDPETGRQIWSVSGMSGEVGPSPAFGGGLIYAANEYATMMAINPETGEKVWQDRYYLPEVSSPLYYDGMVYIATTFAVLAAFDAATGEFIAEVDAEGSFYSSPVIADGRIYVFDLDGRAYIFEPGKDLKLIASPSLGEKVFATPVFAQGRIYIRGNKKLYCIGAK